MLREEATHTIFIVFGLTRLGIEPTIYRTRSEHANHYTTDAVEKFRNYTSHCDILNKETSYKWL